MSKGSKKQAVIFSVETRFQRLARQPGGVSREQAIESAQAQLDTLKPGFEDWLDRKLQELFIVVERALAGESEPDWIDVANHHCRQLRDVGATMGFELVTFIANAMCDIFDAISAGAPCNKDSIACHMHALKLARQEGYRHLKPEQLPELSGGLRRVVEVVSLCPSSTPE
jgi:hypothetical protein